MPALGEPSHKPMTDWLSTLAASLARAPTAVLVISAHWEEDAPTVQSGAAPELLYDYYGFPPAAYELQYPAKGAPELASRVQALLAAAGFAGAALDGERGYDHGVFIPLRFLFPAADVPVLALSLLRSLDPAAHLRLGRTLAPLREDGVLILGSGMHSYHNMRGFFGDGQGASPLDASAAFDEWLVRVLTTEAPDERARALVRWEALAPSARHVHPREEHLLPLLVCVGAADDSRATVALETTLLGTKASAFVFRDESGASRQAEAGTEPR
jgi:aromatic ring-opening dioxygenase catalytic subunit (LigB family)